MATHTGKRDYTSAALSLLVAFVLLAAGTQPASARSYSNPPLKATVKNHLKHMTCVMNGVHMPPMSTRSVDVLRVKLKITVTVLVTGQQVPVHTVPVPMKYLEGRTRFELELTDCKSCRGCYSCKSGALCLRGSLKGETKFQNCPIRINLLPSPPGGGSSPAPAPSVLPPVSLPPMTLPPVSLPPIIPPLGPILAPVVDPIAPILAPVGPILAPIVDPIAPILAPIAPILAPVVNPVAPILAPVIDPVAPIIAPILAPILAPIVAPIAPILPPGILPPVISPLLPGGL